MTIIYILAMPIMYILIKLILFCVVRKYGKFSYDGFSAVGFRYDANQDIFYSTKNAWQKNFGYSHLYDVAAPLFRMIIDTEPVKFYYNNKNWLITFWKGQYGIVTGAEIGIYATKEKKVNKKTIYLPVNDEEMLDMSFILYKKEKEIMRVKARHWWLAIFKLGMFSKPKDLTMDITIEFPCLEMMNAFLTSFKKLGYKEKQFKTNGCTFSFTFKHPRTHKVWTRGLLFSSIIQSYNRKNVNLYQTFLADAIDNNKIDDSILEKKHKIMINDFIPKILKNNFDIDKEVKTKEISEKILGKELNVLLLDDNIYSDLKR